MAISTAQVEERRDGFVGKVFDQLLQACELLTVYLGDRLGLYRALAEGGPATPGGLAERAGVHERYAREWLEQQAVAGNLDVDDPTVEPDDRRYTFPDALREPLLEPESLAYAGFAPRLLPSIAGCMAPLLRAFRTGHGVPWSAYGEDMLRGQEGQNRPLFTHLLVQEWLPALPDVEARLRSDRPSRAADLACGTGWLAIALARGYPNVHVDGFDLDEASIAAARRNATDAGVADRVRFEVKDASGPEFAGRYDLVTLFEALHDLARPVEVLRTMRSLAGAEGAVLVADERVAERFTAPGDDLERFMYAVSVLVCLPNGMAEQPSAATGTVIRPETVRRYAGDAGFARVETLPIEHDVFRFYRLHG